MEAHEAATALAARGDSHDDHRDVEPGDHCVELLGAGSQTSALFTFYHRLVPSSRVGFASPAGYFAPAAQFENTRIRRPIVESRRAQISDELALDGVDSFPFHSSWV